MSAPVQNLFTKASVAERYQKYHPKYHHIPIDKLRTLLSHDIASALDVACGTGHSTIALFGISKSVIGCDISPAMLEEARKHSKLQFVEAAAESLPFPDDSFDLVNISMGVHWLDQDKFLEETKRVLKTKHHLSIDNYLFTGKMKPDEDGFETFNKKFYAENFPSPPRNLDYPEEHLLKKHGFRMIQEIPYKHKVEMDLETFTEFLMTQSNVLFKNEDPEHTLNFLTQSYRPFFRGSSRDMMFAGLLKLYQMIQPK